jgi:hypothetical protein
MKPTTYACHINTYFGWGECDGYSRTSKMAKYRASQQAFYVRNYLPRHLGFYITKPKDTIYDVEFMLAQAAGFDAGFCMELSHYTSGPNLNSVLDAVRTWQEARDAGAFPDELKPLLQNPANSFHLEKSGTDKWKLYAVYPKDFSSDEMSLTKWDYGMLSEPITIPTDKPLTDDILQRFDQTGIRARWPVTESRPHQDGYPPELAVDGDKTLESSWRVDPYPAALTIDLKKIRKIKKIHIYPYWGMGRYYRYTVEISTDEKTWIKVGDMSKNTTPSTPQGDIFNFDETDCRFIRVNMLYHNLNRGVHIVEVEVE